MRPAIEVTQADREAAKEAEHFLDGCGCDVCLQKAAEVFARHRLAEREAVVKWLRGVSDPGATFQDRRLAYQLAAVNFADAVEAGEPFK